MAHHKEPSLPHGFLGPQSKFKEFGLKVYNRTDPRINLAESDDNNLDIIIKYEKGRPVKTTCSLVEANTKEDRSEDMIFTETDSLAETITSKISIPAAGFWKFQIFALPTSDPSKNLICVYNYLIHCMVARKPAYPYPQQYAPWKEDFLLMEPKVLHRDVTGPKVEFRVKVPKAKQVVVIDGDAWTTLYRDHGDVFSGEVILGDERYSRKTPITLNAQFEDGGAFPVLLEYKM